MLERADLPLRDLLGVVVPGLVGSTYALAGLYLVDLESPPTIPIGLFLLLSLVVGLFGFALSAHQRWPWRSRWEEQLRNIRNDLVQITGVQECEREDVGRKVYKMWLDIKCSDQLRARIHYKTGVFYMFTTLSVFSAAAALSFVGVTLSSLAVSCSLLLSHTRWVAPLVATTAAATAALLFGQRSRALLNDVISDGRVAMRLSENEAALKEVAEATRKATK